MSSMQGRLSAENAKATYVHCNCHVPNLCIVAACALPPIRNMNSTITETAYFFHNGAKRPSFLEKVIDKKSGVVKVKDLCRTRWICRHEAFENFNLLYKFLVTVMEAIVESDPTYEDMNWDSKTVVAANGLLKMYFSFTFIVSFIVTVNAMSIIKPISVKLQIKSSDIVKAYMDITEVINELSSVHESEDMLHSWYEQAESLAQEIGVIPEVPHVNLDKFIETILNTIL